ncbi:MAG: nucleoside triphosphate pyrophosphatase [Rhodobacter sp.]|nr:nucleoside triphosphate pyrophosphatase [Rhodobacter sp.]
MSDRIVLASGSEIRQKLLRNAGIEFDVAPVAVDELEIRNAMVLDGAKPRDIADALAEHKARKACRRAPGALVIGCDQVLDFNGRVLGKPGTPEEARAQMTSLAGNRHTLLSAAVIYMDDQPLWRHVGVAKLHMRKPSAAYLDAYIARNWDSIRHSVGGYKLEEEGVRLFERVEGDYFTVLGLPLLELLGYLTVRGAISG